jgi:hypothetical protein
MRFSGDLDMLISLGNDLSGKQNWIKVNLQGVKSNRSAIGAQVLPHYGGKTQAHIVLSPSSCYSCNDWRLHFGLGNNTLVSVEVRWPSGLVESFKHLPINQRITLREGLGVVPNRGWRKT